MAIAYEQQQEEQQEGALVLGDDSQTSPFVNLYGSEDPLTHHSGEENSVFAAGGSAGSQGAGIARHMCESALNV